MRVGGQNVAFPVKTKICLNQLFLPMQLFTFIYFNIAKQRNRTTQVG